MRELDLDVVLDLDIRLYEEKEEMLLKDIYSNSCQITPEKNEMGYDRLIARNVCRPRIGEKIHLGQQERILQICHTQGMVQLDEIEPEENSLDIEGILDVTILYLTSDDSAQSSLFPGRSLLNAAPRQQVLPKRVFISWMQE